MRSQDQIIKTMVEFDALPKPLRDVANEHGLGNVQAVRVNQPGLSYEQTARILDEARPR